MTNTIAQVMFIFINLHSGANDYRIAPNMEECVNFKEKVVQEIKESGTGYPYIVECTEIIYAAKA